VTPHVFLDQERTRIKLMVNVEDGSVTGRSVDQIPVVDRSTINTQALIAEGESLLIGGMVRDSNSSSVDKVPGLGDVPVVGNLFKTKSSASSRVERMFLITPRLSGGRPATSGAMLRTTTPAAPAGSGPNGAPALAPGATPTPVPPARVQAAAPVAPVAVAQSATPVAKLTQMPAARASVVLDLDAPLPGTRSAARLSAATPVALRGGDGKPARVDTANAQRQ
jgi:type III secretion protein C